MLQVRDDAMTNQTLGRLSAATIVCPNYALSCRAYQDDLGYHLVEEGTIDATLATVWGAPRTAGARYQWLVPASGASVGIRLIEGSGGTPFAPYSAWGWNALEIAVADCDAAVAQVSKGPFQVVGPPFDLAFAEGALRAGQLVGPAGEVLYLTEIRRAIPGFELPLARSFIDQPFIAILHSADAALAIDAYRQRFGNQGSPTFELPVDFMARFQGLPVEHAYTLGTVALKGGGYFEIDSAPAHIGLRTHTDGFLPPGIAMVSVESAVVSGAFRPLGALYQGACVDRITGVAGEWIERIARPV